MFQPVNSGCFYMVRCMTDRLNLLYDMIPRNGTGMIDVGTDHAQLPIALATHGYQGKLIASDIHEGPLRRAFSAAEEAGVSDRIIFLRCNGLELCKPGDIDCIVIAGMGGDSICRILDEADWLFSGEYRLVLQPMTHAEVVRYWLVHNEYVIETEAIACEGHRFIFLYVSLKPGELTRPKAGFSPLFFQPRSSYNCE